MRSHLHHLPCACGAELADECARCMSSNPFGSMQIVPAIGTTHPAGLAAAPIHQHPTTADMVASASVAAVFLDSLSIRPYNLRVTELGRVEAYVDPALFDRARRVLLSEGATVHNEDGFVYVEARLDGVPVQVWTGVEA